MVRISNIQLVGLVRRDARASYAALAKKLKVSETAVRKRMAKLEKEGVILGYLADLDYRKLGMNVHALIGLDTLPEMYLPVIEKIKKSPDAESVYTSSGDHMVMVEAHFADSAQLSLFVKKLNAIKGVTKICPAIMLERIK